MQGYIHPGYAASLAEFGTPRALPQSGGWVLERQIPGTVLKDAMGCYPLFCCKNWVGLYDDLQSMGKELVSLALVTDPFCGQQFVDLQRCFEVVIPFKEHFIADLRLPLEKIISGRHLKKVHRALKTVKVHVSERPSKFVAEWIGLYSNLIERHHIAGLQSFSDESFAKQLSIPGTHMLRATLNGKTIGAKIYFIQGEVVHCHLGAVSQVGYEVGAFFAMDYCALEYFADKARWHNLGGGSGLINDGTDGLCRYKRGWASETRTCYFCGKIFDIQNYANLTRTRGTETTSYFPAYRKGEFR